MNLKNHIFWNPFHLAIISYSKWLYKIAWLKFSLINDWTIFAKVFKTGQRIYFILKKKDNKICDFYNDTVSCKCFVTSFISLQEDSSEATETVKVNTTRTAVTNVLYASNPIHCMYLHFSSAVKLNFPPLLSSIERDDNVLVLLILFSLFQFSEYCCEN